MSRARDPLFIMFRAFLPSPVALEIQTKPRKQPPLWQRPYGRIAAKPEQSSGTLFLCRSRPKGVFNKLHFRDPVSPRPMSGTRQFLALLLLALFVAPAGPVAAEPLRSSGTVHVIALAVAQTNQGFVGEHSTIEATVLAGGAGRVYVSTKPLTQQDIQGSVRLAAQVAANTVGVDWRSQDYLVSFVSDSQVIGGPSAGGIMTLALTTALHNLVHPEDPWHLDPTVAGTGTINPDGTIGPVGGIPAKAEGAAAAGIKTFLYPAGQDNATTLKSVNGRVVQVTINMAQQCASLNITCHPEATLLDLIEAAAHVRIVLPDVPTPATSDYATLLSPTVGSQVEHLSQRVDVATAALAAANLQARDRTTVQTELTSARTRLANAQSAIEAGLYYQAATEAFQGAIASGRAENLTTFYASNRSEAVVTAGIAACQAAVEQAQMAVDGLAAADLNAVYAIGAGQQRARDAATLLTQARQAHDNAFTSTDWITSLEDSSFCVERARTASWWVGLRAVFPAGPALADAADLTQGTIDQATDLVSYADAVLGSQVTDAHAKLDAALAEQKAGHLPAAILYAIDAQTLSSVAMQTGGGTTVPTAVLNAAREGASRAINQARLAGAEPILSVSLIELAQEPGQPPATSLQEYWSARTLALLDAATAAPPTSIQLPAGDGATTAPGTTASGSLASATVPSGYTATTMGAFMVMGFFLGFALAGVLVVAMGRRR